MKYISFPYVKYLVTPPSVKPDQHIYRPVIPVKLSLGKQTITFDGLIDSGADECTFPGWIAKTLGHNVHSGNPKIFSGIGGSVLSYLHKTHIKLNGNEFVINVYYSHEWDDMPFGLLGQAGFFVHFDICFYYEKKEIVLKPR
ncbi:MAG: hypothetical protein ABH844_05895 [Candidatus Omnitrophota bacterium]